MVVPSIEEVDGHCLCPRNGCTIAGDITFDGLMCIRGGHIIIIRSFGGSRRCCRDWFSCNIVNSIIIAVDDDCILGWRWFFVGCFLFVPLHQLNERDVVLITLTGRGHLGWWGCYRRCYRCASHWWRRRRLLGRSHKGGNGTLAAQCVGPFSRNREGSRFSTDDGRKGKLLDDEAGADLVLANDSVHEAALVGLSLDHLNHLAINLPFLTQGTIDLVSLCEGPKDSSSFGMDWGTPHQPGVLGFGRFLGSRHVGRGSLQK